MQARGSFFYIDPDSIEDKQLLSQLSPQVDEAAVPTDRQ